jgi:hypothetical protein
MTNDGTQRDRGLQSLGVNTQRVRFWLNCVYWLQITTLPEKAEAQEELCMSAQWVLLTVSRLVGVQCWQPLV